MYYCVTEERTQLKKGDSSACLSHRTLSAMFFFYGRRTPNDFEQEVVMNPKERETEGGNMKIA